MSESEKNVERALGAGWLESIKHLHGLPHDELALFDWYLRDTESAIEQMKASVLGGVAAKLERGDFDDSALLPPQYFIKRVRYSHVIYLASLGEKHLKDTYEKLKMVLGERVSLSLKDLQGEPWETLPKYFQAFAQFSIPADVRKNVRAVYDLRNFLVHQNGVITHLSEQEVSRFRNLEGIEIESGEIMIGKMFVEFAKTSLAALVTCLDEGLGDFIDRSVLFVDGIGYRRHLSKDQVK